MRMNKRSSLPAAADADRAALRTKVGLLLAFLLGIGTVIAGFVGLSVYRQSGFSDEAGFNAVYALSSAVSDDWENVLSPFLSSLEPQDRAALEAQALDLLGVVWERRSEGPESLEQLLGEYAAELRGRGFPVHTIPLRTPCQICTDVNMLKRVVDNLESNLEKYADPNARIVFLATLEAGRLHICISNRTQKPRAGAVESNHIGLRTCDAILKLLGGEFHTRADGGTFVAECILPVIESS